MCVLMPSWSFDDVKVLAKYSNNNSDIIAEIVFGGDLRLILCKDQDDALRVNNRAIDRITNRSYELLFDQTGRSSIDQIDRARRYHVRDPSNRVHFLDSLYWVPEIESVFMRRLLQKFLPRRFIQKLFNFAKGTPLYGPSYELVIHSDAQNNDSLHVLVKDDSISRGIPPSFDAINVPTPRTFQSVTIDTSKAVFEGKTETDAMTAMLQVVSGEATYWALEYATFPAVDAIARCKLQGSKKTYVQDAICLLQVTAASRKDADESQITGIVTHIQSAMTRSQKKTKPIILVFVAPEDTRLSVRFVPYNMPTYRCKYSPKLPTFYKDDAVCSITHLIGKRRRT